VSSGAEDAARARSRCSFSILIRYAWYGSRHARPHPKKEKIARIRETNTHSILLIQELLHLEQLLHGQDMLARQDALHQGLVRWTCAGISGTAGKERGARYTCGMEWSRKEQHIDFWTQECSTQQRRSYPRLGQ
jgi:hypothetical protein